MPSQLTQLAYYSSFDSDQGADLDAILKSAHVHNSKNFITGALWLYKKYFIQVLEGERKKVSETYHRICQDARHSDVVLVGCVDIMARDFDNWWMAYVMDTPQNLDLILKYSCTNKIAPEKLTHERIVQLLLNAQKK